MTRKTIGYKSVEAFMQTIFLMNERFDNDYWSSILIFGRQTHYDSDGNHKWHRLFAVDIFSEKTQQMMGSSGYLRNVYSLFKRLILVQLTETT